jgi:hypothetical protein
MILAAAVLSWQEPILPIRLRVLADGGVVGEAFIEEERTETRRRVLVDMTLRKDGEQTARVVTESLTDSQGRTIAAKLNRWGAGQTLEMERSMVLVDRIAQGPGIRPAECPGEPTAAADLWFWTRIPTPGEKAPGWRFSLDSMRWQAVLSVYHGQEPLDWGGKTVQAHRIDIGETKTWTDGQGRLLRLARPGLVMIREDEA